MHGCFSRGQGWGGQHRSLVPVPPPWPSSALGVGAGSASLVSSLFSSSSSSGQWSAGDTRPGEAKGKQVGEWAGSRLHSLGLFAPSTRDNWQSSNRQTQNMGGRVQICPSVHLSHSSWGPLPQEPPILKPPLLGYIVCNPIIGFYTVKLQSWRSKHYATILFEVESVLLTSDWRRKALDPATKRKLRESLKNDYFMNRVKAAKHRLTCPLKVSTLSSPPQSCSYRHYCQLHKHFFKINKKTAH